MCQALAVALASLVFAVVYRDVGIAVQKVTQGYSVGGSSSVVAVACLPGYVAYFCALFVVRMLEKRFGLATHFARCRSCTGLVVFIAVKVIMRESNRICPLLLA